MPLQVQDSNKTELEVHAQSGMRTHSEFIMASHGVTG